ncbi:O-acetyl-ADP-ribose deacetylase [Aeromicrobium sp. Marseille-Q0843]|uniref:O-acetyl-ADP-ribose deacetylase n=1 Tax=Aeromicrobium phoceense TaxID=2754045 RepID=A0A838XJG1_9ACTN|nr:O-acetyl-ADP-ribose deacetylase [Aeromicrobium phoceense]MBA4608908.1 O-acetyl-ADP-ribose deacetylase [Aeromicrobium phoceense]
MTRLSAIHADITTLEVDAVVNAANSAMRGGGGVDGAIHAAGGPAVLADCIARFPDGLPTGDAGWTTAGDLPARWIIHTVGPNRHAGQTEPALLESCYRRSLEVAADLGAREVAFPLVSAGVYGWSKAESVAAAVRAVRTTSTEVEHVILVGYDAAAQREIEAALAAAGEPS